MVVNSTQDGEMLHRLRSCRHRYLRLLFGLIFVVSVICLLLVMRNNQAIYLDALKERQKSIVNWILESRILHEPSWVHDRSWGIHKSDSHLFPYWVSPSSSIPSTIDIASHKGSGGSLDNEEEIAWSQYFNGTTNGLMLELGAMDGILYSSSRGFETHAGWKVILIEANSQAADLFRNRPNSLSLQLAICQEPSIVHFLHHFDGLGGILEFMSLAYLRKYHYRYLLPNYSLIPGNGIKERLDWVKIHQSPLVQRIPCLPLQSVFDYYQIHRINWMVLDLEGAELAALRSLDYNRIKFDVICVETNRFHNEGDPYIEEVIEFLKSKGYQVSIRIHGRNTWFVGEAVALGRLTEIEPGTFTG